MTKLKKYISYLLLIFVVGFNLWLYYPETKILADPNDDIFQFSLVSRTNWVWQNYGCPLSLDCLPNLTDHVVTTWAEGYPLPFYYSHIPQITIVGSYNLVVNPLTSFLRIPFSLFQYYHLTKYLLMALFPISVFLALRLVGFSPFLSAVGAFFSIHFSTDGLYGIDPPSFLWRGYGLTSQLYAMIFAPLALAFTYRALIDTSILTTGGTNDWFTLNGFTMKGSQTKLHKEALIKNIPLNLGGLKRSLGHMSDRTRRLLINNTLLAIIFLAATTAGHLGIGIIILLSTIPFLFFDFSVNHIILRFKKLFVIGLGVIFILAYWIIPVLPGNKYHIISFWDPIWKFDSYGWYEVVRQYIGGEIFDWQRWPIITALATIGRIVERVVVEGPTHLGIGKVNLPPG